ncbi:hypothetical protein [Hymenobacter sediminicola]|uniref:Uncharacterized protein n=1 Tax=Hymenobacter sediminicola TaxID=2761579 RepID=A0A7G7W325_9BACT|nr:hypothetical protein [Hymenobacter sediminicola]QNH60768.1 hypothetical protein H4317_11255 [Hymenobacter sediminicola]
METALWIAAASAIVSFATAFLNNAFNAYSKLLDSKQKHSEHNMSLRAVYINKKINAGEEIVKVLQAHMAELEPIRVFYLQYRDHKQLAVGIAKRALAINEHRRLEMRNDYNFGAYFARFDTKDEEDRLYALINANTTSIYAVAKEDEDKINSLRLERIDTETPVIIDTANKYLQIQSNKITIIRTELAKYDIV